MVADHKGARWQDIGSADRAVKGNLDDNPTTLWALNHERADGVAAREHGQGSSGVEQADNCLEDERLHTNLCRAEDRPELGIHSWAGPGHRGSPHGGCCDDRHVHGRRTRRGGLSLLLLLLRRDLDKRHLDVHGWTDRPPPGEAVEVEGHSHMLA